MPEEEFNTLLEFFKAMGNESRLKIIGLLANGERTVGELAATLKLTEPTVSQHLSMLKHVGLVEVRPDGNHRRYSFNNQALIGMNKSVFSQEKLASLVEPDSEDEFVRKVFKSYFKGERLVQIPVNEKKWIVILDWFAAKFEMGVEYPEKQVNEIIKQHHADYATIRRDLIERRYMKRKDGIYWRLPDDDEV
ncbi:MAG: metalloregulator ArsR/SmtB family transcription factor [Anaerolineae bacterium]|nr:metalloregulator ArsR/SmtB family transcription factor [Anaerolineae bacterium]